MTARAQRATVISYSARPLSGVALFSIAAIAASFRAKPGAHAAIASIEVEGGELVFPDLISRELTFALGEPFSIQAIEASRSKLLLLVLLLWVLTSCVLNIRPFIHQESAAG